MKWISLALVLLPSLAVADPSFTNVQAYQSGASLVIRADVTPPTPYNVSGGYGAELALDKDGAAPWGYFVLDRKTGLGESGERTLTHDGFENTLYYARCTPDSVHLEVPFDVIGFPSSLAWMLRRTQPTGDCPSPCGGVAQIIQGVWAGEATVRAGVRR